MYKGWAIKSSPCAATFNDLLYFRQAVADTVLVSKQINAYNNIALSHLNRNMGSVTTFCTLLHSKQYDKSVNQYSKPSLIQLQLIRIEI
jgi:hypothetical protein